MNLAPILLTVWNRPEHTRKTLEALEANDLAASSVLHIFSDYWDKEEDRPSVEEVRKVISEEWKFKKVVLHIANTRRTLGNAIVNAVDTVLEDSDAVIVLEDDIATSPAFLTYMNNMLQKYADVDEVSGVSGYNHNSRVMKIPLNYNYDTYFSYRPSSWGWATWKKYWDNVDWEVEDYKTFLTDKRLQNKFCRGGNDLLPMLKAQMDGKINSWAIRFAYYCSKKDWLTVYPVVSYVENIGLDDSGHHSKRSEWERVKQDELNIKREVETPCEIRVREDIGKAFKDVYAHDLDYFKRKIKAKILGALK